MTIFVHQRILDEYGITDTDHCACDGFKCIVHCPACGSVQCYAFRKGNAPMFLSDSPKPFTVRAFRCKQCGDTFTELASATSCHARRRFQQKTKNEERVANAIHNVSSQTVGEVAKAVEIIRQRRGLSPAPPKVDEQRSKLFDPPKLDDDSDDSNPKE
jgi:hypothetical protein